MTTTTCLTCVPFPPVLDKCSLWLWAINIFQSGPLYPQCQFPFNLRHQKPLQNHVCLEHFHMVRPPRALRKNTSLCFHKICPVTMAPLCEVPDTRKKKRRPCSIVFNIPIHQHWDCLAGGVTLLLLEKE